MKYKLQQCVNFLKSYSIKKEFVPVFSYHYLQTRTMDRTKMMEQIKFGISKNPSSIHSVFWTSSFQCTNSVVDLIHYADKYNCRLIIDVNPYDVYTRLLWKGVQQIYPDTLLFDTYRQSEYIQNGSENVKIYMSDDSKTIPQIQNKTNVILASAPDTNPSYGTWVFSNGECQTILFVPLLLDR
jgi:hypothetical protein